MSDDDEIRELKNRAFKLHLVLGKHRIWDPKIGGTGPYFLLEYRPPEERQTALRPGKEIASYLKYSTLEACRAVIERMEGN